MKIILGSKSARRKELLKQLGYDFTVDFVEIDEIIKEYKNSRDYVKKVVFKKGLAVSNIHQDKLVICADTIVVIDENILNKPADKADARRMMNIINNNVHKVMTAVYLKYKDYEKVFVVETKVYIDKMSEDDIETYINSSEPYDKAGGYAIQGIFAKHILKINGDFYNVMGLPINKLNKEIQKIKAL